MVCIVPLAPGLVPVVAKFLQFVMEGARTAVGRRVDTEFAQILAHVLVVLVDVVALVVDIVQVALDVLFILGRVRRMGLHVLEVLEDVGFVVANLMTIVSDVMAILVDVVQFLPDAAGTAVAAEPSSRVAAAA